MTAVMAFPMALSAMAAMALSMPITVSFTVAVASAMPVAVSFTAVAAMMAGPELAFQLRDILQEVVESVLGKDCPEGTLRKLSPAVGLEILPPLSGIHISGEGRDFTAMLLIGGHFHVHLFSGGVEFVDCCAHTVHYLPHPAERSRHCINPFNNIIHIKYTLCSNFCKYRETVWIFFILLHRGE